MAVLTTFIVEDNPLILDVLVGTLQELTPDESHAVAWLTRRARPASCTSSTSCSSPALAWACCAAGAWCSPTNSAAPVSR